MESCMHDGFLASFSIAMVHSQSAKYFNIWLSQVLIFEVSVLVARSIDNQSKRDTSNQSSDAEWNWFRTGTYERFPALRDLSVH